MKNKSKKIILFSSFPIVIIILAYACFGTIGEVTRPPKAESSAGEILPNGESKAVDVFTLEPGLVEWSHNKEAELKLLIAAQTKLDSKEMLVKAGPMSNVKDAGMYTVACVVVLQTELTFDDDIINKVVEDIVSAVTQDTVIDAKISKESIAIENGKGALLYPKN